MKSQKKPPRQQKAPTKDSAEAPTTEFLTIGWLLTVMTTLVCEVGYFVVTMISSWQGDVQWLELLAGVLMFAALIVGLASVALLVLVHRMRKSPPPMPIVAFSLLVGLTPVLVAIARALRS
jgi:hypothetical protein